MDAVGVTQEKVQRPTVKGTFKFHKRLEIYLSA